MAQAQLTSIVPKANVMLGEGLTSAAPVQRMRFDEAAFDRPGRSRRRRLLGLALGHRSWLRLPPSSGEVATRVRRVDEAAICRDALVAPRRLRTAGPALAHESTSEDSNARSSEPTSRPIARSTPLMSCQMWTGHRQQCPVRHPGARTVLLLNSSPSCPSQPEMRVALSRWRKPSMPSRPAHSSSNGGTSRPG